jgi:hypothetical protein
MHNLENDRKTGKLREVKKIIMYRIDVTLQWEDSFLKMDEQNDYATSSED